MVHLALMLAVVIMEQVHGSQLPPLPMKDGCYLVSPEVEIFRQEGEAVILSFTMFRRTLTVRRIAPPTARFIITKDNGTEGEAFNGDNRVQQSNGQLWFLPAQASDSAQYVCTYRNESYCITGSIRLHVYESSSTDIQKMYYLINLTSGQKLRYKCPSLDYFNKTGSLIEWYKVRGNTLLILNDFINSGRLIIPAVKHSHAGLYTCQLRVLINNKQYKVSRTIQIRMLLLQRFFPFPHILIYLLNLICYSIAPVIPLLLIVSPLNGTIFESQHGSALELFCQVLTECQMSDSTAVTWLVNGQSVELSYLDGRALQGGRRVIKMSESCQIELKLIIVSVTEEDVRTELKCVAQNEGGRQEVVAQLRLEDSTFTWIVVAVVAVCCFLMVVSIFLYALFKPKRKKKADYILARQNSTF
uniref:Interleukin-1 receptor type 2-like n=1 Tax=Echeneis naucrates TaxID=173247 RepID=A0A665VQA2_ECHNA